MTRLRRAMGGFTLVETLMAMSLVCAVLLPVSFQLYQSRAGRAAMERFRASQALEDRMNRALLLHLDRDWSEEIPGPFPTRFDIHPFRDGSEVRLLGTAKDKKGRLITQLQAGYFEGKP